MNSGTAIERLRALTPGRHYGGAPDGTCWVMVGRNLTEVSQWSIVPPAASLTFAWGEGSCSLFYDGGSLQMGPGDWMWIDAHLAHRGENAPGSDFLTVFIADELVVEAGLDLAPIGVRSQPAPKDLADTLTTLAVLLLDRTDAQAFERPALDLLLDYVGTVFEPRQGAANADLAVHRARAILDDDPLSEMTVTALARTVGLTGSELSRRFKKRYRLTPITYRKQLRLLLATQRLMGGHTVSIAAHEAGFSDAAHLSRTFKAQYGIAPSAWVDRVVGGGTRR